jgi:hypothetical protein
MQGKTEVKQGSRIRRMLVATACVAGLIGVPLAASPAQAEPVLWSNWNSDGVQNNPSNWTVFQLTQQTRVTSVATYHWNYGYGATPGTISILDARNGTFVAGGYAQGQASGPYQNVNWIAPINRTLPAGYYAVYDSDLSTWSHNWRSGNAGFAAIYGSVVTPPPPPPTPQPAFTPCMVNSGSWAMFSPCSGPVGTVITIQLRRNIPAPLASVVFRQDRNGSVCWTCAKVTVSPLGGGGTTTGSRYTLAAPAALCLGASHSKWHVFPFDSAGNRIGDIGIFMINC